MISNWKPLTTSEFGNGKQIFAPWTPACDDFQDATYLKIEVEGHWTWSTDLNGSCSPDGLTLRLAPETLLLPDAPAGAILGKIGGSSAALGRPPAPPAPNPLTPPPPPPPPSDTAPSPGIAFLIGGHAVIALPDKHEGPLFITFNTLARPVTIGELVITVSGGNPT